MMIQRVYAMLNAGETEGVFQMESGGMTQAVMGLQSKSLEDIIAIISLYRPGPMESIPTYIANRHNPGNVKYKTPQLAADPGRYQRMHRLSGAGDADLP